MPQPLARLDDLGLPRPPSRVVREQLGCGVCGRSLLTGERAVFYAASAQPAVAVCELCAGSARQRHWTLSEEHWEASDRLPVEPLH